MAAAHQLQRQLALAHAALAGQQHADAQHLHEHAVQGDFLRQQADQVIVQMVDDLVAGQARGQQRCGRAFGVLEQVLLGLLAVGDDDRRRGIIEKMPDGIIMRILAQTSK